MVKETPSRKNAGAHYTPKSLAEEVVLHALRTAVLLTGPLPDRRRSAVEAQVLRRPAEPQSRRHRLRLRRIPRLRRRAISPTGSSKPGWRKTLRNAHRHDLHRRAIREVVANCLYGADINDMAVEMCKLSLWLVSLDRDLPFSFVDDKIFLGNSLLGLTSLDQLRKLHIDPSRVARRRHVRHLRRRHRRHHPQSRRPAPQARQRDRRERPRPQQRRQTPPTRRTAPRHSRPPQDRRRCRRRRTPARRKTGTRARRGLREPAHRRQSRVSRIGRTRLDRTSTPSSTRGLTPTVPTDYKRWRPTHWVIEAPDVIVERGGFDAIIGNPPFLGGKKLIGCLGSERPRLACQRARRRDARAMPTRWPTSSCARSPCFHRAERWGSSPPTPSPKATPARSGLTGWSTRDSPSRGRSRAGPGQPAASTSSTRRCGEPSGHVADDVPRISDDAPVKRITTLLEPGGRVEGNPLRLDGERGHRVPSAAIVLGLGFVLEPDEAQAMDRRGPTQCARCCFPYLNGEDLNSRPDCSASRWVIDFNDCSTGRRHRRYDVAIPAR